ncbi:LPS export ABC transporter periplasmic protein LptC [bacterium]|nr:MAG: LPS export ABC transporter periplasmic protein LptC [bacterium]
MNRIFWFALAAAALIASCAELQQPPSDPAESVELPEQELYDATITFYQEDKLSSILQAGRIRKFEKKQTILMDSGIIVDFFDENGRHATSLWADSGRADERTRDLLASGHVIAISDSGQRLESSVLRWDQKTRRIISDAPVKIATLTDTIYGSGFVSDQHLKNWTIERPEGKTFRERPRTVLSPASPDPSIPTTEVDSTAPDSLP